MFGSRRDNKAKYSYSFPQTKVKNVSCVHCKHQFFVREFSYLHGPQIPLVLDCGHPICEACTKSSSCKTCPICKTVPNESKKLPLNLYALGLIVVSHNRPITIDDPDISFYQPSGSKSRQLHGQGYCYECNMQATMRCQQCSALYCSACYSKIHGRALQNHTKVMLSETDSNHFLQITNHCSESCNEPIGYYCKECEISGCSHCMLRLHPKHDYVTLEEKNDALLPDFCQAYDRVAECLHRVHQAQKKLKSVLIFPSELQNSEKVEASISQHFTHLHGVLQNIEKKMIDKLYQQRNYLNKNLEDIRAQLRVQEDQLQSALLMAASAKDNFENVDIEEVTKKLEELADIPCHLVQNPVSKDEAVVFDVDKTIITVMEKHCTIQVPPVSSFNLLRTGLLPEDYEMEPLSQELSIPRPLERPFDQMSKKASSTSSLSQSEKLSPDISEGAFELVCVTYIYNPSEFYVQQVSCQQQIASLNKDIANYVKSSATTPTKVTQNKLYIVQFEHDMKWYRGRVTAINKGTDDKETYNIFYVDYGNDEDNVPLAKIRNISPRLATLPMMSIKCSLYNVVPNGGKWHPDASKAFWDMVNCNSSTFMHVIGISGNTYYVDICVNTPKDTASPLSIRDSLVFMKYGTFVTTHKLMRTNPQSIQKFFNEELSLDKFTDVVITSIESPDLLYVVKTEENTEYLEKMTYDMTTEYEKGMGATGFIYIPEKGLPCAAQGTDGFWYRAMISDVLSENKVEIFYVDLGYSAILDSDMIRILLNKYMACRTQAIKISLKPLSENLGKESKNVIKCLKQFLRKPMKVIPFEKNGDVYSTWLFTHDDINVSSLSISKNVTDDVEDCTQVTNMKKKRNKKRRGVERLNESTLHKMLKIKDLNTSKDESDPFKLWVHVHQAKSPDCIYVADAAREQSHMEMMSIMQEFYNKYHSKEKENWAKDDTCAVYSVKDKSYCRAKIVDIKSTEEVIVFFYDMAIQEAVPMKNIQPLHSKFLHVPAYLFKVKLSGILPCGGSTMWPSLSSEKLNDIINENQTSKFYISKIEDTKSSVILVELWVKQVKTTGPLTPTKIEINSVNRMLVEMGVALPIKDYEGKKNKAVPAIEVKQQLAKLDTPEETTTNKIIKWFSIESGLHYSTNADGMSDPLESPNTNSDEESNAEEELSSELIQKPHNLTDWLPAAPIEEDQFIAIPTFLDHDCILYLHSKKESNATLQLLEEELEKAFRESKLKPHDGEWKKEDLCIAQYHGNKKWYRGRVLEILKNGLIHVEFVDYGNVEECVPDTLRKATMFGHIPIQCTKCVIHGLNPVYGKWKIADLDKIHALLIEKECEVTVLRRTETHLVVSICLFYPRKSDLIPYLTDILIDTEFILDDINNLKIFESEEEDESLTDNPEIIIKECIQFVDDTLSKTCTGSEITEEDTMSQVITGNSVLNKHKTDNSDESKKILTDNESTSWYDIVLADTLMASSTPQNSSEENMTPYKQVNIPNDIEFIEIELCFNINPTEFYARLKENAHSKELNVLYNQYNLLMDDLQESACKQPVVTSYFPNTPCCAVFENDDTWYRCLIKESVQDSEEVKLAYVDFGNEEYYPTKSNENSLRVSKEEWLSLPTMAVRCKLWNIEAKHGIDFHIFLSKIMPMYNKSVIAKIKRRYVNFIDVELYAEKDCKDLLYNSLIDEGLLRYKKTKED